MNMFRNTNAIAWGVVVAANALVGLFLLFSAMLGWAGGIALTLGLWPLAAAPCFLAGVVLCDEKKI
jgi:hypothetical protein